MARKLAVFRTLAPRERRLLVKAALLLGVARLVARFVPMRELARWLARAPDGGDPDRMLIAAVRAAVLRAAGSVPWKAVCMQQALAAKLMLAMRGCGSTFHFGAGYDQAGRFVAHVWLVAGSEAVVGGDGVASVAEITSFGATPRS